MDKRFKILSFPNPRLRIKAKPVSQFDNALAETVDTMFATMYYENGIGLAATQVSIDQQIIVMDISDERNQPMCYINPRIIAREGITAMTEGCLSVPDFTAEVKRALKITVEVCDVHGAAATLQAEELLAICLQHEIDHLHGKLFIDYLPPIRRQRFLAEIRKNKNASRKRRSDSARLKYLQQWQSEKNDKSSSQQSLRA